MKEIKEIAEGNYDDGDCALNKIDQSQKVKLAEMAVEILEHILVRLDDKSLLRASHVCTKFASVAETAFAHKYETKWYEVCRQLWSDNLSFHEVILSKYGEKIRKLQIQVYEEDERLLDLAERTCCNLNSLSLYLSTKMIHPTGLKEVYLVDLVNLNRASFTEFIHKNQQLEMLYLIGHDVDLLDVLDGLNNLKTLEYWYHSEHFNDLPTIRLNALETLKLRLSDSDDYVRVLRAITCNDLKSLSISGDLFGTDYDRDLPEDIAPIFSFGTLVSLQLNLYEVTEDQLKLLAFRLPHLTEFGMGITENVEHNIQLALRILPKLTKLTIGLDADDYHELSDDLKKSMRDFHARFVVNNTEIELVNSDSKISISKDRTFAFDSRTSSLQLLWMENLNEKTVRKVLDEAAEKCVSLNYLKIINCTDSILDISKFMHTCSDSIETVEIESKGPITVNANATRYPSFFPRLKVLSIKSENHPVVNLLQKLDEKFCKQIEQLIIVSTDIQNDADQELEHGNDITNILAKFENMKKLRVKSSAIIFDATHLLSVCPNLKDLRILYNSNK